MVIKSTRLQMHWIPTCRWSEYSQTLWLQRVCFVIHLKVIGATVSHALGERERLVRTKRIIDSSPKQIINCLKQNSSQTKPNEEERRWKNPIKMKKIIQIYGEHRAGSVCVCVFLYFLVSIVHMLLVLRVVWAWNCTGPGGNNAKQKSYRR